MKFNGLAKLPQPVAYLPSDGLVGFAQSYRQHPLARADFGQYAVNQMRCGIGHSATTAGGAKAAAFA